MIFARSACADCCCCCRCGLWRIVNCSFAVGYSFALRLHLFQSLSANIAPLLSACSFVFRLRLSSPLSAYCPPGSPRPPLHRPPRCRRLELPVPRGSLSALSDNIGAVGVLFRQQLLDGLAVEVTGVEGVADGGNPRGDEVPVRDTLIVDPLQEGKEEEREC